MVTLIIPLVVEQVLISHLFSIILEDIQTFFICVSGLCAFNSNEFVDLFLAHCGHSIIIYDSSYLSIRSNDCNNVILSHILNFLGRFLNKEVVVFSGQLLGIINQSENESVEELVFEVALEVNFAFHLILFDFDVVVVSIFAFNNYVFQMVTFGELVVKKLVSR